MLKKDFTLVIPTHNRHNYLKRILDYYKNYNFSIIVCDSSKKRYKEKMDNNVRYMHVPKLSFAKKMFKSFSNVKTKYSGFCADDDFYAPEGIKKCVAFLKKNKDYSSVEGNPVDFFCNNGKTIFGKLQQKRKSVVFENPYMRLRAGSVIYGISTKNHLKRIFELVVKRGIDEMNTMEVLISRLKAIWGKHKVLNVLLSVRERQAESTATNLLKISDMAKDTRYKKELTKFENILVHEMAKKTKKKENENRNLIKVIIKEEIVKKKNKKNMPSRKIINLIPKPLLKRLRERDQNGTILKNRIEPKGELKNIEHFINKHRNQIY